MSRLSSTLSCSKSNIRAELPYSEATTRTDRSTNSMASTTNVSRNMELISFGRCSPISSSVYLWLLRLRIRFFVCMVDCHLKLILLIRLGTSIGSRISHIMVLYAISCGLILLMMARMGSILHLEELDIAGERISVINLCIETISKQYVEHIN